MLAVPWYAEVDDKQPQQMDNLSQEEVGTRNCYKIVDCRKQFWNHKHKTEIVRDLNIQLIMRLDNNINRKML